MLLMSDQVLSSLSSGVGAAWDWFWARVSVYLVMWWVVAVLCNVVLWSDGGVGIQGAHLVAVSLSTCVVFVAWPLRSARASTRERLLPGWGVTMFLLFLLVPAIGGVGFSGWEYWVLLVFALLLSVPFVWIIVSAASRSLFVFFASVVHVLSGAFSVYMVVPLSWDMAWILVFLPIGFAVPMSFATILMLGARQLALRYRCSRVTGALTEAIMMALLVLPVAAAAIISVEQSGISEFWQTFGSVCVGLFFGNVVGVPFSRFLREASGL